MFNVVTSRRKRRVWTLRTVAASVGAHLLLLGVFVTIAESRPSPRQPPPATKRDTVEWNLDPVQVVVTRLPESGERHPVRGDPNLQPPGEVPDSVPTANPDDTPVREPTGHGPVVNIPGTSTPNSPPRRGDTEIFPVWSDSGPIPADSAEVLPHLADASEAQRMLQRVYPPLLRDGGITGRTTVVLIIDRDGNVQPGSVQVRETTHRGFDEAAVRAVQKFHFTPAEFRGHPVSVVIAIPIEWQLQR